MVKTNTDFSNLDDDFACENILYGKDGEISGREIPDNTSDDEVLALLKSGCAQFKSRQLFLLSQNYCFFYNFFTNF